MRRLPLFLLLLWPASGGAAQHSDPELTLKVAPRPDRVERGVSRLTFAARVRRTSFDLKVGEQVPAVYRVSVRCGPVECYKTPDLTAPAGVSDYADVTFGGSYPVPSSMKPGDELCSVLQVRGPNLMKPGYGFSQVTAVCRTVASPAVAATGGAALPATTQPGALHPAGATQVRAGSQPAGRASNAPDAAARLALNASLPDLEISFENAPVARWLVRNRGQSISPATSVRFVRGSSSIRLMPVPQIFPGNAAGIVVLPELDQFLVNASAMVDPEEQIKESSEDNNTWMSSTGR
jgi:hypothetical protein